jgi:hypothetical protein
MDTTTFYAAAAALCFSLLGFWWVVVEFRHDILTRDAGARTFAFVVSLHFLLPGLASLASLLSTGFMWRVVFALAGLTGLWAVVVMARHARTGPLASVARRAWVAVPVHLAICLFAAVPDVARNVLGLEPLQAEGMLLILVVLFGVLLAWQVFTDPAIRGDDAPS